LQQRDRFLERGALVDVGLLLFRGGLGRLGIREFVSQQRDCFLRALRRRGVGWSGCRLQRLQLLTGRGKAITRTQTV